jgi:hypothetical protein
MHLFQSRLLCAGGPSTILPIATSACPLGQCPFPPLSPKCPLSRHRRWRQCKCRTPRARPLHSGWTRRRAPGPLRQRQSSLPPNQIARRGCLCLAYRFARSCLPGKANPLCSRSCSSRATPRGGAPSRMCRRTGGKRTQAGPPSSGTRRTCSWTWASSAAPPRSCSCSSAPPVRRTRKGRWHVDRR